MPDTTSTTASTASKVRLGDTVVYTDRQGFEKAALVVGTRKSIRADGMATRPDKGTAHLEIHSVTGNHYVRQAVPQGEGPGTFRAR